ncbi:MFS transporter [Halococcus sediminicola]|uniref:MFS transporter n=1 Tax=Halococcus sediminicola TaxID=1264579 RepID=UPI000ADF2CBF|nr:MFS transporter [Halococcus sediminicola]
MTVPLTEVGMRADPRLVLADRIYYGWVVVIACLLASIAVFGTSYAFGVFYDAFIATFAVSRTVLAVVFGLQTALLYVTGVAAGQFVERYGQRFTAAISGLFLTIGVLWTAFARSYLELVVSFGVVAAIGMGGLYVIGYASVPLWFDRRRGAATGIASAGLGIGLVTVPPTADALITTVGWRGAMLAIAVVVFVLSALVTLLFADDPAAVNIEGRVAADSAPTPDGGNVAHVRSVVLSRRFLLVFVGWVLVFAPLYVLLGHAVLYADDAGFGRSVGVFAVTAIGIATTVARLGVAGLSDWAGRTRTFVVCGAVMALSSIGIALAPSSVTFLACVAVFGVGYGGCGGLLGALVADLFGNTDLNTLFAAMSLSLGVAGIAAPPLAGLVFESVGGYPLAFLGFGGGGLLGAGCIALAVRIG